MKHIWDDTHGAANVMQSVEYEVALGEPNRILVCLIFIN